MKFNIITAAIMLSLTPMAQAMSEKPEACPNVDALQAAGLSAQYLEHDSSGWTAFNVSSKYDNTGKHNDNGRAWSFAVTDIQADNQADAYTKAKHSLDSLQFVSGPFEVKIVDEWGCYYQTSEGYKGIAFTNPDHANPAKVARAVR